jgi:hypothetical protein
LAQEAVLAHLAPTQVLVPTQFLTWLPLPAAVVVAPVKAVKLLVKMVDLVVAVVTQVLLLVQALRGKAITVPHM